MPQDSYINKKQELEKEISKLQRKMQTLQKRQRRPIITSIVRTMLEYEISPEEINDAYEKRIKRRKSTANAAPRYQNPETGDTWTGRGRPPRWIADAEKQGKSRDQFLINKE